MLIEAPWSVVEGEGPLAAVAVHDGHDLRKEVASLIALSDSERLAEEDPHTGVWTAVAPTRLVAKRSRFEVDLNRPRDTAVYSGPQDAWGLRVWKSELPGEILERSLAQYDAFYAELYRVLARLVERHGRIVVLDLHSYNHRRGGPQAEPADPGLNPEVNIGTGTMVRERWASIVDRFISDLRSFDFLGRHLDARENVKFKGRRIPQFIHERFPHSACALAVEFKKFFMDEHTGRIEPEQHRQILCALRAVVPGLLDELGKLGGKP